MDALDKPLGAAAPADTPGAKPAAGADAPFRAQATAAAEKFESFFIGEMLKQMRRSARELGGDDAVFKDRLNDDMLELADGMMADSLSTRHAFGIADVILRQLLPAQDPAPALNGPAGPVALDKQVPIRIRPNAP